MAPRNSAPPHCPTYEGKPAPKSNLDDQLVELPARSTQGIENDGLNVTPKDSEIFLTTKIQEISPLLRLPVEIRVMIWELVLGVEPDDSVRRIMVHPTHGRIVARPYTTEVRDIGLLGTCRQIYLDAFPIPLTRYIFSLDVFSLTDFLSQFKGYQLDKIVRIQLEFDLEGKNDIDKCLSELKKSEQMMSELLPKLKHCNFLVFSPLHDNMFKKYFMPGLNRRIQEHAERLRIGFSTQHKFIPYLLHEVSPHNRLPVGPQPHQYRLGMAQPFKWGRDHWYQ